MRRKIVTPIVVLSLFVGALFYAASGRDYDYLVDYESSLEPPTKSATSERRMVDMVADDSYLIERGDSTIFILVGNFAAHHNGTVILADSAVRYPNQSFVCYGNVLINQNDTYAYGDRAEYNRDKSTATIYSDLVKVVDGDAVMYTYHCTFDTARNMGRFYGGCYVEKGESLLEAERGYYNTDTHDLIAVDNVEMRDESYLMTGDSVIFNTQTEDARYFTNTNIWNDKDEYLFANEGSYTKARDLHHLTRDAYILSPEREIWSDTIEYFRTDGHIIGRRNIQMDDTTQKILGFADYGEWWDEPGNALFTRRPSMISYDLEQQSDSMFLSADTLWLYTIPVLPPTKTIADTTAAAMRGSRTMDGELPHDMEMGDSVAVDEGAVPEMEPPVEDIEKGDATDSEHKDQVAEKGVERGGEDRSMAREDGDAMPDRRERVPMPDREERVPMPEEQAMVDSLMRDTLATDSLTTDSLVVLTAKQMRYQAKLEKRRVRDSIRMGKRAIKDSLQAIKQAERDSVQHILDSLQAIEKAERDSLQYIRDSLLRIKIDSIVAKRIEKSSRLADEEAARMERIRQKAEERERRKIDKAKARALKRGKEYKGKDYTLDTLASDTAKMDEPRDARDTMGRDSLGIDSLGIDSLAIDSLARDSIAEIPFPEDSVYKMIKAYRRVRMFSSDSQIICDSMVLRNTDSVIRLYLDPVMWQETNQISSDSMAIYTRNQVMTKAHFMGAPMMGMEIDTMYYNQVKGKDMIAYFEDGSVYRNDVNGNAQTIYYMQGEDDPEVTGMMYIESASISFYLIQGQIDKITYKQNPEYVLYPIAMVPETQQLKLDDFEWYYDRRPARDSVCDREIRPTRREDASSRQKPRFRITERIDYDRRRLVENRMWVDRVDELTPEVIEWRNSRPSYQKRK